MAVFLVNVCKFNSCGRTFASLSELIRHIEEIHLDCEQKLIETVENPTYLPVSCVLRIFSNQNELNPLDSNTLHDSHVRKSLNSPVASLSTTPTEGSEIDCDELDSDSGQSSIDSWATANADSTANPLLKYHQIMGSNVSGQVPNESPKLINDPPQRIYICGISGCTKQYRSSNSLSHHRRSAHKLGNIKTPIKTDDSVKKLHKCHCGKTYKTSHGLKSHYNFHHKQQQQTQVANTDSCNTNLAILANGGNVEIKPEQNGFVCKPKTEISSAVKETLLNSISMKNGFSANSTTAANNQKLSQLRNNLFGTELISDTNCPPVLINVEVSSEPKSANTKCPSITAPTLQQHLLSPIIPKVASI